jgi:hypothetical protein
MIVLGVVVVSLNQKQHDAVEEIEESVYSIKARLLANTYAKYAVSEVVARKKAGNDILTCTLLKDFKNVKDIANSHIRVFVSRDTLKGEAIEIDDYAITSVSHVEASYGTTYVARTNLLFKYGADFTPPPDGPPGPLEIDGRVPAGMSLVVRLLPNGMVVQPVSNASDHNTFHNIIRTTQSVDPTIPLEQLESVGFNVRFKGPIDGAGIRFGIHTAPIAYSVNIYIEGNVTIENSIRTTSPEHKVRMFVENNVYWGTRHNSGTVPNPYVIHADVFAHGLFMQAAPPPGTIIAPYNTVQIKAHYVNAYINAYGQASGTLNNSTYNLTGLGTLYAGMSKADIMTLFDLYAFPEDEVVDPNDPDGSEDDGSSGAAYYMVGIRSQEEHPIQVIRP